MSSFRPPKRSTRRQSGTYQSSKILCDYERRKGHDNVLLTATFKSLWRSSNFSIWKLQQPGFSSGATVIEPFWSRKTIPVVSEKLPLWILPLHLRRCFAVQEKLKSHQGNADMQLTAQPSRSHPGQPSGWSAPLCFITKEGPWKSVQG